MDHRQAVVEHTVRTIIAKGVSAAQADDFDGCIQSLDEAVAVYESNPSYVHTPHGHFPSLRLLVHATQSVWEELGRDVGAVRELGGRLDALRQTIH